MEVGAGLPHDDWIGGRWFEGWEIGIKLPCGRFSQNYWLFKAYLLEFDIGRLGKIWIQQGR
jgi:hypothetical protein